jgi:aspartyl protease family protein
MWPSSPDDQARLFYLAVLLLGIASFFLLGQRQRLSQSVRDLVIWLLIFVMVIIAYGFRDTLGSSLFPQSAVQLSAETIALRRGADGHFRAELEVNGTPVRFIVDTGASDVVLSRADAERVGIDTGALQFTGLARTANGVVATAPARLGALRLGSFVDHDVPARVNAGELDVSLLGMAYLDRFARIEIAGDSMLLSR